ncbi:hypothetical protein [Burkholderia phage FLC6]|nr:hypothetical protein [Burkholderia phage FLC6]BDD79306.1 hypothetical protein [Burkholderia phage FLC8]
MAPRTKLQKSMTNNSKIRDAVTNSAATISVGEPSLMSRQGAPKSIKVQIGKGGLGKAK